MRIHMLLFAGAVVVGAGAMGCRIPVERSGPGQDEAVQDAGAAGRPPWLLEGEEGPPADAGALPAADEGPAEPTCETGEPADGGDSGDVGDATQDERPSERVPNEPDTSLPTDAGVGVRDMRVDASPRTAWPTQHGEIVISEVMADPAVLSDSAGEWVELYNASEQTLSLEGCALSDLGSDVHVIGTALEVEAGAYAVLARSEAPGFTPDYVYDGFGLTNSADEVVLHCADGLIDEVVLGGEGPGPEAGVSLTLAPSLLDAVANDDGHAWCEGNASYNGDLGTPGEVNSVCGE